MQDHVTEPIMVSGVPASGRRLSCPFLLLQRLRGIGMPHVLKLKDGKFLTAFAIEDVLDAVADDLGIGLCHGVFSSLCFAVDSLLSPGGCRGGGAGPLDPVRPCQGVRLGAALSRRPFPVGWRGSPRTLLPGAVGRLRFACCGPSIRRRMAKVNTSTCISAICTNVDVQNCAKCIR